jgi:hypothetical protein
MSANRRTSKVSTTPQARARAEIEKSLDKQELGDQIVAQIVNSNGVLQLDQASVRVEWLKDSEYLVLPQALFELRPITYDPNDQDSIERLIKKYCVHPKDVGFLHVEGSTHPDMLDGARAYRPKLCPETVNLIAALNLSCVGNSPILAYTRAVGVSCGLLPSANSALNVEYVYTDLFPKEAAVKTILDFVARDEIIEELSIACAMLLARYGLEHLTYDHTLRSNDPTFKDRFNSVVNGSALGDPIKNEIIRASEVAMRACVHPFGLASTLGFAYWAKANELIPANLQLRVPPIHHSLMVFRVVDAGLRAIGSLPVASTFQAAFAAPIKAVRSGLSIAQLRPWEFSPLCRYYGTAKRAEMNPNLIAACEALLPIVAGFTLTFASSSALSHARSIGKLRIKADAGTAVWESAFTGYQKTLQTDGLSAILYDQAALMSQGMQIVPANNQAVTGGPPQPSVPQGRVVAPSLGQ